MNVFIRCNMSISLDLRPLRFSRLTAFIFSGSPLNEIQKTYRRRFFSQTDLD